MDSYVAFTCSEELQEKLKQMQNKNKKGIDLAASGNTIPNTPKKNKKNKVAEFRDRLMRGF